MVRMIPGCFMTSSLQPLPHHLDLIRLRKRHPKPKLPHVIALSVPGKKVRHINGLEMVMNHPLHEFNVRFGRLNLGKIGRLINSNHVARSTRRAGLDKHRLNLTSNTLSACGVAGSYFQRNKSKGADDRYLGFH